MALVESEEASVGIMTPLWLVVLSWLYVATNADKLVVRKCCPEGKGIIKGSRDCRDTGPWDVSPPIKPVNRTIDYQIGMITCEKKYVMPPNESLFYVTDKGLIVDSMLEVEYCLETFYPSADLLPILCLVEPEENIRFSIYPVFFILSVILFLITLFVYIFVIHHCSLHSLLVIRYIIANIIAFVATSIMQLDIVTGETACTVLGFAVQFFFLATFFWLNVMCIDIYCAFSGFKSLRGSASERDRKKLLVYSAYAWGMPLLILSATVAVDYCDSISANSYFKPNMGKDRCFFKGRVATWTYFYAPMAMILLSNLILFGITAFRIWNHRRETAVLQRGDSRRHDGNDSERFNLYLKLFLVMGINWISELVSYMFGKDVPQYLWYITDITNTLQGVFIFLIFVWKKRVRRLLWDKLWKGKKQQRTSSGNNTTTTSTALTNSR